MTPHTGGASRLMCWRLPSVSINKPTRMPPSAASSSQGVPPTRAVSARAMRASRGASRSHGVAGALDDELLGRRARV